MPSFFPAYYAQAPAAAAAAGAAGAYKASSAFNSSTYFIESDIFSTIVREFQRKISI